MAEERIDKWLWAVRVFKTRTLATDACKKGRVYVGENAAYAVMAKPSRTIKPGDIIHVKKTPIVWSFRVVDLTNNRVGAKLVPQFMENVTSHEELNKLEMVKISGFVNRRKGLGRPTKKEGRELSKFNEGIDEMPYFDDMDLFFDDDIDSEEWYPDEELI